MPNKILFPTDYSAASNAALRIAASLARQADAQLLVVHVRRNPAASMHQASLSDSRADSDEAALLTLLAGFSHRDNKPVAHDFRILRGNPATEIVRFAQQEHVDLIVMATAGRSGLGRVILGSVAEAVIRAATCPVLAFKEPFAKDYPTGNHWPTLAQDFSEDRRLAGVDFREAEPLSTGSERLPALELLERAVDARATDVHLDPVGDAMEVRFRIDGRLERYCRLGTEIAHPLTTQLKVLAEFNIADPFRPQEGRINLPHPLGDYEARLATVPVIGGESVSLRLLSRARLLRPLDSLGLDGESSARLRSMLQAGEGLVLVTGPAGSGKTTTAYSMIHALDDGHRNIVTIEDPPEYRIAGFRQMAVDPRHGVTMTSGLRTLLRMDPDVVLVGEIRDAETAETAMRAASSGKYVFATLHTRDVASTITALRDLHVDNRSLGANLAGIISQRLVRCLCPDCRRQISLDPLQARCFVDQDMSPPAQLSAAEGCAKCRHIGYFERIGIFEVLCPTRTIREAIELGANEDELRDLIHSAGTRGLLADGLNKVCDGVTTLEEVRGMTWVPLPAITDQDAASTLQTQ